MPSRIEDYALIGDCHTAALVSNQGSIDWLCVPRFDSPACFAALLGTPENGRFRIAPATPIWQVSRRYRPGTLILETTFRTPEGEVLLIDFMPQESAVVDVVRIVVGIQGSVPMHTELAVRFDYGNVVPWVTREGRDLKAIAGPDMIHLHTPVELTGKDLKTVADFTVAAGDRVPFVLTFHPSHLSEPTPVDAEHALKSTERLWLAWSRNTTYEGAYVEPVERSLLTLKAMTYAPTGGLVAAATTSLPEHPGGVRNWDYRFCWLRDATITLYTLLASGHREEARAWREWLIRAVAGSPDQLQIMYSISGRRRLTEIELPWLDGFLGSKPVRIGNAAHDQLQLDVYGELMDAMHQCRRYGLEDENSWALERTLLSFLESKWEFPDEGIWEIRGGRRHFTHSKVMAWVAFDRGVAALEQYGREGPLERWKAARERVRREVCEKGFNPTLNAFTQSYGSDELDASLLLIPLVGFLPAHDPRVISTIHAIERDLTVDGLVRRYRTRPELDGLPEGEGAFLACSFWLVENLTMIGRHLDAVVLFERLLSLRNDVGLLAEEYDPHSSRQLGNFPQAFSHLSLVSAARTLARPEEDPVTHRTGPPPSVSSVRT